VTPNNGGDVDTLAAFAMGNSNRGKPLKVFDWNRAAALIRDRQAKYAAAGLSGDWEYTGGDIYKEGKPVPEDDTYTYLASTWASPEINVDGDLLPCWRWQSEVPPEWGTGLRITPPSTGRSRRLRF
jgi:hypothetical protein